MGELRVEQGNFSNFIALGASKSKNLGVSYKNILADELNSEKTFSAMCDEILSKYLGQSTNFYQVMDASGIKRENWTHNDFPYEKFLENDVDKAVLTWKPTRANPSQLDSDVQNKLTATLGKNSAVIPPKLAEKLETDSDKPK